ncbi:MAG: SDR family oxidoreductase [Verrucomicrobiales bacterium]|nr:SDR family oxidoreductase [Verrucomicrobiales bacterium]
MTRSGWRVGAHPVKFDLMRVLIVGCGYVGLPLGETLVRRGHEVFGLRRSTVADERLRASGIVPLHADISQPDTLKVLPFGFDWVVHCAATQGGGVEDYQRVYLHGNLNLIEWLGACPPRKFVYTSSTGVYGQNDGSVVTEESPTAPGSPTAQVLVAAEQVLLAAAKEGRLPAVILRVAGIYGPGRGYWLRQFLSGQARLEGRGQRVLNMIHRDDLVSAIETALVSGRPGEIYNVVDDEPVCQRDFFQWLASQTGLPMPGAAESETSPLSSRAVTNKRVSNRKLRHELGWTLRYPTFREGCLAELQRISGPNAEP